MRRLVVLATAITALSVLASVACSSDKGTNNATGTPAGTQPNATQPPGTVVATPTALVSIVTVTPQNQAFGRQPVNQPGELTGTSTATVTLAQANESDGYDRMTFQLDGIPGFQVQYVQAPITSCASGATEQIQGQAFLQIRLSPAQEHDSSGNSTVAATDLAAGLPAILEAKQTCDFEGVVTWVLGLTSELDFRTFSVGGGILVVDVKQP
jgi:hypothetical protein